MGFTPFRVVIEFCVGWRLNFKRKPSLLYLTNRELKCTSGVLCQAIIKEKHECVEGKLPDD